MDSAQDGPGAHSKWGKCWLAGDLSVVAVPLGGRRPVRPDGAWRGSDGMGTEKQTSGAAVEPEEQMVQEA